MGDASTRASSATFAQPAVQVLPQAARTDLISTASAPQLSPSSKAHSPGKLGPALLGMSPSTLQSPMASPQRSSDSPSAKQKLDDNMPAKRKASKIAVRLESS